MKLGVIILVSAIMLMLAGCQIYDYSEGKEIPVSIAEDDDEFKSELDKLQLLIEEDSDDDILADLIVEEEVEIVEEEVEEVVEEEVEVVEIVEEVVEEEEVEEEEEVVEEVEMVEEETTDSGIPTIKVKEGDLVDLSIESEDADADSIVYTFTEPLDEEGKWQTGLEDAGKYTITVTASDGELSTSQDVILVVEEKYQKPVISEFDDMTVSEGDTIKLTPKVTDPEEGSVILEYSGWMSTSTKEVGYDDAGSYEVTLKVTNEAGESTSKTITITVEEKNRAPKILSITNK